MNDNERELLHTNSKDIGQLTVSLKYLANTLETMAEFNASTNTKIETMVDAMNSHSLLSQKVDDMDAHIREAFSNRDKVRTENLHDFEDKLVQVVKTCNDNAELKLSDFRIKLAEEREIVLSGVDAKGYARLWKGLSVAFVAMGFIFGYLYLDIREVHNAGVTTEDKIVALDKQFTAHVAADSARRP